MSPILVTIIPFDFGYFCHQNWRKCKGITKIGDNFVENQCGLIYAKERHKNVVFSSSFFRKGSEGLSAITEKSLSEKTEIVLTYFAKRGGRGLSQSKRVLSENRDFFGIIWHDLPKNGGFR